MLSARLAKSLTTAIRYGRDARAPVYETTVVSTSQGVMVLDLPSAGDQRLLTEKKRPMDSMKNLVRTLLL